MTRRRRQPRWSYVRDILSPQIEAARRQRALGDWMFTHVSYVMVNVSEMGRAVAFYRDTLGLPLKFESPGWTEFDTGATTLALHLAPCPEAKPAGFTGPAAGSCAIGFSVKDLEATWKKLQSKGTRFVMPPTLQEKEGILLAVFLDPDGMAISIAQPVAQAE